MERSGTPGTVGPKVAARVSGRQPGTREHYRPLRGLSLLWTLDLGFRCAPPQALRRSPLPRAGLEIIGSWDSNFR